MIVDCAVYDQGVRLKRDATIEGVRALGRRDDSFVWVALVEPTAEEFATVSSEFDLHELPSKTPSKPTSGPRSSATGTCSSSYSRRSCTRGPSRWSRRDR